MNKGLPVAMGVVPDQGMPVAMAVPIDTAPLTHVMARSVEESELMRWVSSYPVSGGPRPDQFKAYGWFDSMGWAMAWPLHRAAMRGEAETIRQLCAAGHDPNAKMHAWFDSEPLGWAASLGHLSAVIALIQCGADPLRPPNMSGFRPLTDAYRERHFHVATFLNEYQRHARGTTAIDASRLFDKSAHANGGPRPDQAPALPCCSVLCLPCFAICPTSCCAMWGCAPLVDCLTSLPCKHIPCTPCDPNARNPLWFCAQPAGWAASFGQLHTVMALVKNGADPAELNLAGNNAYSDAGRERHEHVIEWLVAWEAAGKPRGR
mmetsp:Transcript_39162/g.125814  ORF Transcript_39162/g.125814 Transcript_39162/m.125814 type:complete len:319 (+) Transcript_39162:38-994(+)